MLQSLVLKVIGIPSKIYNIILMRYRKVKTGKNVRINGRIKIFGKGNVIINDNVSINSSVSSNPIGGDDYTILSTGPEGSITIGKNSGLSNVAIVSHSSIVIGENVKIGGSVHIYDTDFHSLDYKDRIREDKGKKAIPVRIGDNVFIGAFSIILKGVTIGKGSIIGAGSVVTKNVPEYEIWAGNPARHIRTVAETEGEKNA